MTTHSIPIVGNHFRSVEERAHFEAFCADDLEASIFLLFAPDNPYDPNAVEVHLDCGEEGRYHVGYVPRNATHILHDAWAAEATIDVEMRPNSNMMEITITDDTKISRLPEYAPSEIARGHK